MIRKFFLLLLSIIIFQPVSGQDAQNRPSVYKINKKTEIPLTIGLYAYNSLGFQWINSKPGLDSMEIIQLDVNDVPKIDREATRRDVSKVEQARKTSDLGMLVTLVLPGFLMLDENIRKDWLDLLVLYTETHAINSGLYVITAGSFDRIRPYVYNPDYPYNEKTGGGTQISFFSGHVSMTATASFFMAKVYSDYHPEIGNKKYWLYLAALIPPAFVGYYRSQAMRHFPTDVLTGMAVGAAMGIWIPQLHKNKNKDNKLSFMPYSGKITGLSVRYSIK